MPFKFVIDDCVQRRTHFTVLEGRRGQVFWEQMHPLTHLYLVFKIVLLGQNFIFFLTEQISHSDNVSALSPSFWRGAFTHRLCGMAEKCKTERIWYIKSIKTSHQFHYEYFINATLDLCRVERIRTRFTFCHQWLYSSLRFHHGLKGGFVISTLLCLSELVWGPREVVEGLLKV